MAFKKLLLYLVPLLLAFMVMILINEYSRARWDVKEPYTLSGRKTMNSAEITPDACTWKCHNDTNYCKQHHVKWLKPFMFIIDPLYFLIIRILSATGSYGAANILLLVIMWPLLMCYLLIKPFRIEAQIRHLKK